MKKINKLMRIWLLACVSTLTIGFQSCGDYLDVDDYIDQMTSLDSVFSRKSLLEHILMERHNISPMKVICGQIRLLLFKGHLMRILLLGMMIVMRQSNSYSMKSLLILSTIIIVLIIITIRGIIKESVWR